MGDTTAMADTMRMADHAMMTGQLGIPQSREGSGTSWLPDASPMYAVHSQAGPWSLMFHGNVFLQYIDEGGERGESQIGSVNWLMGMAQRPLGGGALALRAMVSAEPFTVGECGFPQLLQSGESCNGEPLHDRQHPHDLFMELAAKYDRALTDRVGVEVYGGPVAEPALGPTAFPHRPSSMPYPSAPISHHWLDASHISFGSVTAGLFGRSWKAEASVFNGREPDENRYDFDFAPLDSYSGRLTFLPTEHWALQASAGHLREAEPGEDGNGRVDVDRYTASATHSRLLGETGVWASTLAWGRNVEEGNGTNALLAESSVDLGGNVFFGRAEWVEKTGHDLVLPHEFEDKRFGVSQLMGGYMRQLAPVAGWVPGIGGRASVSLVPSALEALYGERAPVGLAVWVNLHPAALRMGMGGMGHGGSTTPPMAPAPPTDLHGQMPAYPAAMAPDSASMHAGMSHGEMPGMGGSAGMPMAHESAPGVGSVPVSLADIRRAMSAAGVRLGEPTTEREAFWSVPTTRYPLVDAHTPRAALEVNLYASAAAAHQELMSRNAPNPAWRAPARLYHVGSAVVVLLADPAHDDGLVAAVDRALAGLGGMRMELPAAKTAPMHGDMPGMHH
jgi:hypothetical protein